METATRPCFRWILDRIAFYCIAKLGETVISGDLGGNHKSIFEGVSPRGAGGVWRQARDPKSGHITNRSKKRYAETTLDPGAATVRERSSSSIALANPTAPSRGRGSPLHLTVMRSRRQLANGCVHAKREGCFAGMTVDFTGCGNWFAKNW